MAPKITTWRNQITMEMIRRGETWADVIACTLSEDELDRPFDGGHGIAEGQPFTLWTERRVYFPCECDGAESVASVPRDPCPEATKHVG